MTDIYTQPADSTTPAPRLARKVAVVLNGNARAVSETTVRDVQSLLTDEHLYVSRSLEQWKFIARRIVNKGYDVVLLGGGDGTFAQCVSDIVALDPSELPAFGILRLGTGNGLASTMGISKATLRGISTELRRARQVKNQDSLPFLKVEGRLAPFTGVGLDSLILEDYNAVKRAFANTPLKNAMQGGLGYASAIAFRSIPRFMFTKVEPHVTIRNEGAPAQQVDVRGNPVGQPIPRGAIIYKGPVSLAACSAVPYYGLELKLFPHALRRPDRFALRVTRIDLKTMVLGLPKMFAGTLEDERIKDFHCTAVSYKLEQPTPLQIGGDEVGRRDKLHVRLTHVPVVWGDKPRPQQPEQETSKPSNLSGTVLHLDAFRKALSL